MKSMQLQASRDVIENCQNLNRLKEFSHGLLDKIAKMNEKLDEKDTVLHFYAAEANWKINLSGISENPVVGIPAAELDRGKKARELLKGEKAEYAT